MSAPTSFKPSDMVQSMEVKISTVRNQLSQTDIDNLVLGENKIRLTHPAMINHCINHSLATLNSEASITIVHKYTQLIQQSAGATFGYSSFLSDNNIYSLLLEPASAYSIPFLAIIYSSGSYNYDYAPSTQPIATFQQIADNIIGGFTNYPLGFNIPTSPTGISYNVDWLPNGPVAASKDWYLCSGKYEDYVAEQIILYAVVYSYISTMILGYAPRPANLLLIGNVNITYPAPGISPITCGLIIFNTGWPFDLSSLTVQTMNTSQFPTVGWPNHILVPYDINSYNTPLPYGVASVALKDMGPG